MDKNKSLEKTQQQMKLCSCMKFDNIDAIDHMDEINTYEWNLLYK